MADEDDIFWLRIFVVIALCVALFVDCMCG